MEMLAKSELIGIVRERYLGANKKDKTRILDELVAVTGHHRKHAVRLLSEPIVAIAPKAIFVGRKIYHDAVKDVLVTHWGYGRITVYLPPCGIAQIRGEAIQAVVCARPPQGILSYHRLCLLLPVPGS